MAEALPFSSEGETAAGMSRLSERLCSLGLSAGSLDALESCLRQELRQDLLTAIELMRQCFVKVHACHLRLEQDPETGEEWLVLDVTLQEDVDAALTHFDIYTDDLPCLDALSVQTWIDGTGHRINREWQIEKLRHTGRRLGRIGNRLVVVHVQNRHVFLRRQPVFCVVEMLREDGPECLVISLATLFTPSL